MTLLALETATPLVGAALWDAERGPLASFTLLAGRRHAETLLPGVDQLLHQCHLTPADLRAVAVDVGPGLFTGLRVGLSTARTLADALGLPAVGVTSLEVLAYPHRRRPGLVASVVDARRAEVFWTLSESDGALQREVSAPVVATPEEAARALLEASAGRPVLLVGDGARRYRDVLQGPGWELGSPAEDWPGPVTVAELGQSRLQTGLQHAPLQPLYLRQADVRIGWEEVGGRVEGHAQPTSASSVAGSS